MIYQRSKDKGNILSSIYAFLLSSTLLLGAGSAHACSVHDHFCTYHAIGQLVTPDIPETDAGIYIKGVWNENSSGLGADLDVDALLPDGAGPYAIQAGGFPHGTDPFDGVSGEHSRHNSTDQHTIIFSANTAEAKHSVDANGAAIIPGGHSCSDAGYDYCETVRISGNVPTGEYRGVFVNYDQPHLSDPSADGILFVYKKDINGSIVYPDHGDREVEFQTNTRAEISDQLVFWFENHDFNPHAQGVSLDLFRNTTPVTSAYEVQSQHLIERTLWETIYYQNTIGPQGQVETDVTGRNQYTTEDIIAYVEPTPPPTPSYADFELGLIPTIGASVGIGTVPLQLSNNNSLYNVATSGYLASLGINDTKISNFPSLNPYPAAPLNAIDIAALDAGEFLFDRGSGAITGALDTSVASFNFGVDGGVAGLEKLKDSSNTFDVRLQGGIELVYKPILGGLGTVFGFVGGGVAGALEPEIEKTGEKINEAITPHFENLPETTQTTLINISENEQFQDLTKVGGNFGLSKILPDVNLPSISSRSSNNYDKDFSESGVGSYTNTHASGVQYHGKGSPKRAEQSAKEKEAEYNDPIVDQDFKYAKDDREAFKDEAVRIREDGGIANPNNYNKINSPGEKYLIEDER